MGLFVQESGRIRGQKKFPLRSNFGFMVAWEIPFNGAVGSGRAPDFVGN